MRLIDGDALVESIVRRLGIKTEEYLTAQESVIVSEIYNAPTIEQELCWIPCSERLPEATGFYICTVNRELFDVRTMKFEMLADGGYRWLLNNGFEVFPSFVLAWMPLPTAYKEEENRCSSK